MAKVYRISDVPCATPVTTPDEFIVATAVLELLHVPPGVVLAKVVVDPTQTLVVPVMLFGKPLTVTVTALKHPVPRVYLMEVVPAVTPVTTPEVELTVARPDWNCSRSLRVWYYPGRL